MTEVANEKNMDTPQRKYAPLWSKYRPAILKMMMGAAEGPQQYRFMKHEFTALNGKKGGTVSFSMIVSGSKPVKSMKDSETALDLLNMLQLSSKGSELLRANSYEIVLDRDLVLHVSMVTPETATQ